ncbi:MAG: lipase [Deltaproteobacteria bacterium]|nr:lipase [Deltaproteobacteria bacterium]
MAVLLLWTPPLLAQSDPPLRTDPLERETALRCPEGFAHPEHEPVLLVHGTGVTPDENWGWNYLGALPAAGFDTCTVKLPRRALGDIQVAAEFVVHAVRRIHAMTGRKVDILGHSQGGLEPRWALKYWPDLRAMVDDVVTLGTPHHGTVVASLFAPLPCASPACLQMRVGSDFLRTLNDGDETPGEVSYTSIYSAQDTLVQPSFWRATARLEGAANIRIQDVCPLRYVSHVGLAWDSVVFEMVVDAFTRPGGTDPGRLSGANCWSVVSSHVDPLYALRGAVWAEEVRNPPPVSLPALWEPALASYVGAPGS